MENLIKELGLTGWSARHVLSFFLSCMRNGTPNYCRQAWGNYLKEQLLPFRPNPLHWWRDTRQIEGELEFFPTLAPTLNQPREKKKKTKNPKRGK